MSLVRKLRLFGILINLISTLSKFTNITAKIPTELKVRIKKHGRKASKIMREALEREVARVEVNELDARLEKLVPALKRINIGTAIKGIRDYRER